MALSAKAKITRVLVVDDDPEWCSILINLLSNEGYQVDSASTIEDALTKLANSLYHLITLDIRFEDRNPKNEQGMELLRNLDEAGHAEVTNVIMLSAFGTKAQMRESFKAYKVRDFVEKQGFKYRDFLTIVHEILDNTLEDNTIPINFPLQIVGVAYKPKELVTGMKLGDARLQANDSRIDLLADELDDLLRRLFPTAIKLMITPIAGGFSGAGVIQAKPYFDNAGGQKVVVKFGERTAIKEEHDNFEKYVRPFAAANFSTNINKWERTPRLGGIIYTFVGTNDHQLDDFGTYYEQEQSSEKIASLIDGLFNVTCQQWYANRTRIEPLNLTDLYWEQLDIGPKLVTIKQLIALYLNGESLKFPDLSVDVTLDNPLSMVGVPLWFSSYRAITHGDLNERNILVDDRQRCWLIDFRSTGTGHILRDFAELDISIRLELLRDKDATLTECYQMESMLLRAKDYRDLSTIEQSFETENKALAKAFAACVALRKIAGQQEAQNPERDIKEFYTALYFYTLNAVRFSSFGKAQREHAILSASLLVKAIQS